MPHVPFFYISIDTDNKAPKTVDGDGNAAHHDWEAVSNSSLSFQNALEKNQLIRFKGNFPSDDPAAKWVINDYEGVKECVLTLKLEHAKFTAPVTPANLAVLSSALDAATKQITTAKEKGILSNDEKQQLARDVQTTITQYLYDHLEDKTFEGTLPEKQKTTSFIYFDGEHKGPPQSGITQTKPKNLEGKNTIA
jgi:hypothetical protein